MNREQVVISSARSTNIKDNDFVNQTMLYNESKKEYFFYCPYKFFRIHYNTFYLSQRDIRKGNYLLKCASFSVKYGNNFYYSKMICKNNLRLVHQMLIMI